MSSGCTGLKTDWTSTIKTTAQFPVYRETVVEVTCTDDDATLMGDSHVTCISGTDFTHENEPWCSEITFRQMTLQYEAGYQTKVLTISIRPTEQSQPRLNTKLDIITKIMAESV
ncbi:hypothetical protein ACHWQZ_G008345 [Mnemiopsis leidyi]